MSTDRVCMRRREEWGKAFLSLEVPNVQHLCIPCISFENSQLKEDTTSLHKSALLSARCRNSELGKTICRLVAKLKLCRGLKLLTKLLGRKLEEKEQELCPVKWNVSCCREEDTFADHKLFSFIFTPCSRSVPLYWLNWTILNLLLSVYLL